MLGRDYRDILGGGLLIVLGLAIAAYAQANYAMGTLRRMGPGMFPAGVGLLLAVTGALTILPALFRPGRMPQVKWGPMILILLSVAVFALAIRPFGLIPAVAACVLVAALSEPTNRPLTILLLAVTLPALAWLVFVFGLRLPMQPFRWPF